MPLIHGQVCLHDNHVLRPPNVDIKTVSAMQRHYNAGFTLRTYTHTTCQKQDEVA